MHQLHPWLLQLENDHKNLPPAPSQQHAQQFIDQLIAFLFPTNNLSPNSLSYLQIALTRLETQLHELLLPLKKQLPSPIDSLIHQYFATLPSVYNLLQLDAKTILQFDPAAVSLQEVVSAYPGFKAISVYRLTHQLAQLGVPIIPRLLSEYAHNQTGIDIHPKANIGNAFFIDHGTGVVIGETTVIGNNVKIYQGVTLGALNVQKNLAQTKRHPTIEDNVIIYSNSTILGGNTVIGHNSIIGGNTWITDSVPPYSLVYHKAEVKIRNKQTPNSFELDFVI